MLVALSFLSTAGSRPLRARLPWQGFGKRLMFGCEAFAAELGLRKMSASVDSSQKRLLQFYLGMGGGDRKSFKDVKSYKRRKRWLA